MNDTAQVELTIPSFDDIIPAGPVRDAVNALGFSGPTMVQAKTIPAALSGQDIVVQARTGSGKTFAFVVPMLIKLERAVTSGEVKNSTFGIVITPTRELATQIKEVINSIAPELKPVCLIGGASTKAQIDALKEDPRIVVGTPGRIMDLIRQRELVLKKCQMFVLDEADEMLSMGFVEDVRAILSRLPDRRQGLFVSATITPRVNVLSASFLTKPEVIVVSQPGQDLAPIEHCYYEVGPGLTEKASALVDLIEILRPRAAMIFCNTKSDTELVEIFLRRRGYDARKINSDLSQKERDYLMAKVKAQELRFLVGTDIASRGIDIEEMDLVINYALPDVPESYVHRSGRTGRAGRAGTALSLVGPQDFMAFTMLKRHVTFELKKLELPTEDEVLQARLAHFYEVVREAELDVKERDRALARILLREMGTIEEPNEEITDMVAKLCRFTVEHFVNQENLAQQAAASIAPPPAASPDRQNQGRRQGQNRGRAGGDHGNRPQGNRDRGNRDHGSRDRGRR